MNFLATTPLENLLLLLFVVGLSALSPWLTKKHTQANDSDRLPREAADPPPHAVPKNPGPRQQLDTALARVAIAPLARSRARSSDSAKALTLLRHSQTIRQAFVASLVFGEPKAFEG